MLDTKIYTNTIKIEWRIYNINYLYSVGIAYARHDNRPLLWRTVLDGVRHPSVRIHTTDKLKRQFCIEIIILGFNILGFIGTNIRDLLDSWNLFAIATVKES